MAHETHHEEGHHHHHNTEATPKISLFSAFWFVLILVGLFVAAVNFVNVESSHSGSSERYEGTNTGHEGGVNEEKANEGGSVTPTTAPASAGTVKESENTANPQPAIETAVDTNKH